MSVVVAYPDTGTGSHVRNPSTVQTVRNSKRVRRIHQWTKQRKLYNHLQMYNRPRSTHIIVTTLVVHHETKNRVALFTSLILLNTSKTTNAGCTLPPPLNKDSGTDCTRGTLPPYIKMVVKISSLPP